MMESDHDKIHIDKLKTMQAFIFIIAKQLRMNKPEGIVQD